MNDLTPSLGGENPDKCPPTNHAHQESMASGPTFGDRTQRIDAEPRDPDLFPVFLVVILN
ncbi:hypothetical protein RSAG8_06809, partial [Rhizoctonia solani AG-8 WAC10335]